VLAELTSGDELRRWYWTKTELADALRARTLSATGSKLELTERLAAELDGVTPTAAPRRRARSRFDWGRETLTLETVITDSYRNSQNMRRFMKTHASDRFAFSNEFMAWMRDHVGSTLAEAVEFWKELDRRKREEGYREAPLPQNQYNAFSRALAAAQPGISAKEIRRIWARKRAGPAPHRYEPGDEHL